MKEKQLLKRILLLLLAAFLLYLAAVFIVDHSTKDLYSDSIDTTMLSEVLKCEPSDFVLTVEEPDILKISSTSISDGRLYYSVEGLRPGTTALTISNSAGHSDCLYSVSFLVAGNHLITNLNTGNFVSCRAQTRLLLYFLVVLLGIMLYGYLYSVRHLGYSYQSIFYSGFFIWLCATFFNILTHYLANAEMILIYEALQTAGSHFILRSFPFIFVFSVALTISNISLIRREHYRFQNTLGIILSFMMLGGGILGLAYYYVPFEGYYETLKLLRTIFSIYTSLYCLAECFLFGSILCGFRAALHEPALDKDYIIILGCKIRDDGTLYPLIRGRVDRALAFYHKQLNKTGKDAFLIPSGGQGKDEVLSEAEAMKRYLLEKGIPETQILPEDQSRNTLQNMQFSRKLIEERTKDPKVAFSTTNYHIFRSGIIARQSGFMPDGMGAPTKWYFWPNAYVREMLGMVVYLKKRLIGITIPVVAFFIIINMIF